MSKWRVCTLDVWGNQEDGYEINNWFTAGHVDIDEADTDRDIWNELVELGIARGDFELGEWDSMSADGFIEIREKSNTKPVFHLTKEEY